MPKQTGLFQIEGTMGGVTFYRARGESLVRTKGGVSRERINTDPAFARTRENNSEFGAAASAGKLIRTALRPMLLAISDGTMTFRLSQMMNFIRSFDTLSGRGERNVANGLATPEGRNLLQNFNFNSGTGLGQVLFKPFTVSPATGAIQIDDLLPANDIVAPQGATHVSFRAAVARLNFETGAYDLQVSPSVKVPLNSNAPVDVTATPSGTPAGTGGTLVNLILIEFSQEVNGTDYSLKNGAFNVLSVVGVA